ncbi:hypothetical protein XaC1_142 [Xanthomonas phage XaC1]|nr:hypothetical protein XaC1_142 [Xanthomonas phage XaC1]
MLVLSFILVGCYDSSDECSVVPTRSQMEQGSRFCLGNYNVKSFTTGENSSFKVVCNNGNSAEVIVKLGTE